MYIYKLQETDEAKNDLALIAFGAYDYTRDVESGLRVFQNYEDVSENMRIFPSKFIRTSFVYRGYDIRIRSFKNYNVFYIVDDASRLITVLRVLFQKQDWESLLARESSYHVGGEEI